MRMAIPAWRQFMNEKHAAWRERNERPKKGPLEEKSTDQLVASHIHLAFATTFLGYGIVAWAAIIVTSGGYANGVNNEELLRVSFLLLLQGYYLAWNPLWPCMLNQLSTNAFCLAGSVPRSEKRFFRACYAFLFVLFSYALSYACIIYSMVESWYHFSDTSINTSASNNYQWYTVALQLLYRLILITSVLALLQLTNSQIALFGLYSDEGSFMSCYEVPPVMSCYYARSVLTGLAQGKNYFNSRTLALIDMVYDMMSDECRGSISRGSLYSLSADLVRHVYYHSKGFETTLAAMQSPDMYVQEAAFLMVGFLAHLESRLPERPAPRLLRLQGGMVKRLIEVGMDPASAVGGPRNQAALWSLRMLAGHDPRALMRVPTFPEDLVEAVKRVLLRDLGEDGSEIGGVRHRQLRPLLTILNAMLTDHDSRSRFTTQQMALLDDQLIFDKLGQISNLQTSSSAQAASLTLSLLQNATVLPPVEAGPEEDGTLPDPNSAGLKKNLGIMMVQVVVIVGLASAFAMVFDAVFYVAVRKAGFTNSA